MTNAFILARTKRGKREGRRMKNGKL